MKEKKRYRALVGMQWDDLKIRIEAGDLLPDSVSKEEIQELLELKRIEEVG